MYRHCVLFLTVCLLLLTGNFSTTIAAEPLSSSVDALESPGDDQSQQFSSALENADGGGGGRAIEVAHRSALEPQWQSTVHRQQHSHQHQHQHQLPTLELRPVFLSDHFIRQMSPSSSSSVGANGKYSNGQRAAQYYFKPIPRELMPLSSTFLSRGGDETLRARRYTYPTASQSFLRFGRRYKRPKDTKDTAFLRFGRSGQTVATSHAEPEEEQLIGQHQPAEPMVSQLSSSSAAGSE